MIKRALGLSAILLLILAACTQPGPPAFSVSGVTPADEAVGVTVETSVSATFSVEMDEDTLDGALSLSSADGQVAGLPVYNPASRTLTFTPTADLEYDTEYTASIANSIRSAAGGRLNTADYSWTFTTEAEPVQVPAVTDVSITSSFPAMTIGQSVVFEAEVEATAGAAQTVTWTSSDTDVATVDINTGEVEALAAGTTTIRATSTFDNTFIDEVTVTVTVAPAVTGVTITSSESAMTIGQSALFAAVVDATDGMELTVTWDSSDESVASVDPDTGNVEAIAAGTTTIRATSTADNTFFDEVTVTVHDAVSVDDYDTLLAYVEGEEIVIAAPDVTGGLAPYTYAQADGDLPAGIVLNGDGSISGTATETGDFAGTVTVTDALGQTAESSFTITVVEVLTSGAYATEVGYLEGETIDIAAPAVTGGLAPFTYALEGGALPAGVALNTDGTISGAATESGDFAATITVTDALSQTDTAEVTLTIAAPMVLELFIEDTVVHLTDFTAQSLVISGGLAPFTFDDITIDPADPEWADRYTDGVWDDHDLEDQSPLAPGMVIDENTGAISGTATVIGFHRTYVRVTDAVGQTDVAQLEIDVDPAELVLTYDPTTYSYTRGSAFTVPAENVTVTGGVAPYTFSWEIEDCGAPLDFCLDTYWVIDSTNGELGRTQGGGTGILGPANNSDRSYIVTVTDGDGETASFEVSFEED